MQRDMRRGEMRTVQVAVQLKNTFVFYLLFYKNLKSFKSFFI